MKGTNLGVVLGVLFLSSCAIHSGTMTGNASISSSNFKYLGQANGHAQTIKVLGIGGLQKNGLVAKAKDDLYYRCNLSKGQALANVSVDFKRSFFLVVCIEDVYINADVIDFNITKGTGSDTIKKDERYLKEEYPTNQNKIKVKEPVIEEEHFNRKVESSNGFTLDQMVKIPNGSTVVIARIMEFQKLGAIVRFTDETGSVITKFVNYSDIKHIPLNRN